jgi:thiamine-phosphate pyrophosphorylase
MNELFKRLKAARLYLVTGQDQSAGRPTPLVVEEALKGGVDIVQLREYSLRDKELLAMAHRVRELTLRHGALFIVNNRPDIAELADADGVHLGQDDMPVFEARKVLGDGKIVGVSTHAPDQAKEAVADGADYLGVGPVFATPTKAGRPGVTVEYVRQVAALHPSIPFFAIGGIDLSNLPRVLDAGADRVAVVRAITGAPDPKAAAAELKKVLEKY